MKFSDLKLNSKIISVLESKNITEPTEIQHQTLAMAKSGQDVLGVSETGSGKTLAFILPLINQILESDKPFHTLIIVPTRELAQQISDCLAIFEKINIRYSLLLGGDPFTPQVESINKKPHIIVGTPSRIVKHIEKTKNFKIGMIRKLVFDEADRFFEQDFLGDLEKIAEKLVNINQTLMFTATATDKTEKLCSLFMKSPKLIKVSEKYQSVKSLEEFYCFIPEKYKLTVLCNYLKTQTNSHVIVFVALCTSAQKISQTLAKMGISCDYLHGKMPQNQRNTVLKRFKEGDFPILFSTDLASRGLDIPQVDLIINYDLPNDAKTYIHRVGRTARAGKQGTAATFVTQYDVANFQRLEFVLKRKLAENKLELYQDYEAIKDAYRVICEEYNENNRKK